MQTQASSSTLHSQAILNSQENAIMWSSEDDIEIEEEYEIETRGEKGES